MSTIRVHSKSGWFIALLPESLTGGFCVVVTAGGVCSFRAGWSCSRLKGSPIRFEYASNGDLVDIGGPAQPDGPDLLALSQDAREFGEQCLAKRRLAR